MTAPELGRAAQENAVVLLPVGAIEQHGPHLPVDVDISGPIATAEALAAARDYLIIAPPVWWGLPGEHGGFPGLLTLRRETFYSLLWDLCDSITRQGFRLALVVGHASNRPVVGMLVGEFARDKGVKLLQLNYLLLGTELFGRIRKSAIGGDAHAGELETSVQMHLRPELVKMETNPFPHYIDPKQDYGLSAGPQDFLRPGKVVVGFRLEQSFPDG